MKGRRGMKSTIALPRPTEIHPNLFVLFRWQTRAATEMLEHDDFSVVIESLKNAKLSSSIARLSGCFDSLAIRKVEEVLFVTRYGKVSERL